MANEPDLGYHIEKRTECPDCASTGQLESLRGKEYTCNKCIGRGYVVTVVNLVDALEELGVTVP